MLFIRKEKLNLVSSKTYESEAFNIVSYGIEKKGLEITETRKELGLLKTNAQTIEKYAREKYLMKKDNEDLFIVTPDSVTK